MKNKTNHWLCVLLGILGSITINAQTSNFVNGYYLTLEQDTVRGYIRQEGEINATKKLTFRKKQTSKNQTFMPGEISGFSISEKATYESQNLEIDGQQKSYFLKKLIQGYTSLYQLPDNDNPIYLLVKEDGQREQLRRSRDNLVTDTKAEKAYYGQLKLFMRDCNAIVIDNNPVGFNSKDLSDLVIRYNQCVQPGAELINLQPQKTKTKIRFGVTAGYLGYSYRVYGLQPPFQEFEDENSGSVQFGAMASFDISDRFALQAGFVYTSYSIEAVADASGVVASLFRRYDVIHELTTLEIPIELKYDLTAGRIRPFLLGGIRLGYFLNKDIFYTYSIDDTITEEFEGELFYEQLFGLQLGAGVQIPVMEKSRLLIKAYYHDARLTFSATDDGYLTGLALSGTLFF